MDKRIIYETYAEIKSHLDSEFKLARKLEDEMNMDDLVYCMERIGIWEKVLKIMKVNFEL